MPEYDAHAAEVTVKVNGAKLPPMIANQLSRVVVEGQRNLPAMCEVEFNDDDALITDNPLLRPGSPLSVSSAPATEDPMATMPLPLFDGEIVAVEATFSPVGGRTMLVRGYDKAHRLHRTRKTRTFLNQSDSMIATQMAGEVGLAPMVDATTGVHEHLTQANQTNWEFLQERARENGFEVKVANKALVFGKSGADKVPGVTPTLVYGDLLLEFRARVTSAEQPKKTTLRAFNTSLNQEVKGAALPPTPESQLTDPTFAPMMVAARFGATEDAVDNLPLDLPPTASKYATARRAHNAGVVVEAEGRCVGNPALRAGGKAKITDVGKSFSGTYVLSTVRHVYAGGGYETTFTVSGAHDRSLLGLTQPGATRGAAPRAVESSKQLAPVLGLVTNTTDPMVEGRVKVELPWLGDKVESAWAPVVMVGGGKNRGLQVIPEVGDTVLVVFELGDVRRPYVIGGIHSKAKNPMPSPPVSPTVLQNGKTNLRVFQTRAGHKLTFDDTQGKEAVVLETPAGQKLELIDKPQPIVRLSGGKGKAMVEMDATNNVTIKAGSNLTIDAVGNIDLAAKGNIGIKATGQLNLEGTGGVKIDTPATLTAKATGTATFEATGAATVKSTGILTVQGSLVKIN